MMLGHLRDPALPGLETVDQAGLSRITGAAQTRLLRARYHPGTRAILHVALGAERSTDEGAIWFYPGNKAQKLAQRLPNTRLDGPSGALFQPFPQDHRIPKLATFLDRASDLAPHLIGGPAMRPPELMRYRPGLSATFRWMRADGRAFFVKQTPHDDPRMLAEAVGRLADAADGGVLAFAPVAGIVADLGLIAYEAAPGRPLDGLIAGTDAAGVRSALSQVAGALRELWSLSVVPPRMLDRVALLQRAWHARMMIALLDPEAGRSAAELVEGLVAHRVPVRLRPIHGDMKLEHAFLSGAQTTLIDTESMSLGDPDYDLATLDARVTMAEVTGQICMAQAEAARAEIRRYGGAGYDWFLTCASLHCVKFFAQRFDPATIPTMSRVLTACRSWCC